MHRARSSETQVPASSLLRFTPKTRVCHLCAGTRPTCRQSEGEKAAFFPCLLNKQLIKSKMWRLYKELVRLNIRMCFTWIMKCQRDDTLDVRTEQNDNTLYKLTIFLSLCWYNLYNFYPFKICSCCSFCTEINVGH